MIYAIQAVGTQFIKFGRANSVSRRLSQIETGCPLELNVLAVADWHDGIEKSIHQYLDQHWERGEWFRKSNRTDEIIGFMLDGGAGLEAFLAICRPLRIAQAQRERRRIIKARVLGVPALEAPVIDPAVFENIKQKALQRKRAHGSA